MVLTEAVTNVIQHNSEGGEDQEIRVILEQAGDEIRVEVRDGGRPFDPLKQPGVIFPRTLDEASQGGLGIHLIRSYSDECGYRHEGDENVLTLVIRDVAKPQKG
jgi:anti-sigma regulatory factor (Ser/Thr protein kinase)